MKPKIKCANPECGIDFAPRRENHIFHSDLCSTKVAREARRERDSPRGKEDTVGFTATLLTPPPPKTAIGYRMYCRELDLMLPLHGSQRWDRSKPGTDYFRLRPLELPLVPLKTTYIMEWVLAGGGVQKIAKPIFVSFARDMRNKAVDRAMKSYRRLKPALPPLACQIEELASRVVPWMPARELSELPDVDQSRFQSASLLATDADPVPPLALPAVSTSGTTAPALTPMEILAAIKQLGPEALAAFQAALVKTPITIQ